MIEELVRSRGALLAGHFLLSSGMHSDQYVQCARLFEDPRDAERLGKELAKLSTVPADLVVSPALGGILIGYEVARALGTRFLFTERQDGVMMLRRGFQIKPREKTLIVEDVLTTGKSTLEVAAVVKKYGGALAGVLSVINRGCDPSVFAAPTKSLFNLPLKTYTSKACPLCAAGKPIDKPGSRLIPGDHPVTPSPLAGEGRDGGIEYKLQRNRADKIQRSKILEELEKVARTFNYIEFGWRDFNTLASISHSVVKREFGRWKIALEALNEHLRSKGLVLTRRSIPYNQIHSDEQLFKEMERIWLKLEHRPSRTEWEAAKPQFAYGTYRRRFGGWTNACLKFIEHKMGRNISDEEEDHSKIVRNIKNENKKAPTNPNNSRTISLKLRLQVLARDNFRCVYCGKSPATQSGVILHIDHIIPFSRGGKGILGNLQTLCHECNLGKGNNRNIRQLGKIT